MLKRLQPATSPVRILSLTCGCYPNRFDISHRQRQLVTQKLDMYPGRV
jgi:hypothetical protein